MSGRQERRERLERQRREAQEAAQGGPTRRCRGSGINGPGCAACCTTMEIKALAKPAGIPCPLLERDGNGDAIGCSVYATSQQPQECRDFRCGWLADPGRVYTPMDRPDILGVMFTGQHLKLLPEAPAQFVREVALEALESERVLAMINKMAQYVMVVVIPLGGARRLIKGPSALVEAFLARSAAVGELTQRKQQGDG